MANAQQREHWNNSHLAEAWPKRERLTSTVTPVLLDALALQPGERVLDIGCGGGTAALRAAGPVGSAGAVVGVDLSEPLIGLARGRATEAGLRNVAFQVADAQTDRFEGAPFDAAMSQLGVMFFDDPVAAFANVRGQLVAGGRLALACWQSADRNPAFVLHALAEFAPPAQPSADGPEAVSPTGAFAFADAGWVGGLLEQAGFGEVAVARHDSAVEAPEDTVFEDASLDAMGVPEQRRDEARAAASAYLSRFRTPSGLCRFPLAFQIFTARAAHFPPRRVIC